MIVIRKLVDAGPGVRYADPWPFKPDLPPPVLTLDELREKHARLIAPLLQDKPAEG